MRFVQGLTLVAAIAAFAFSILDYQKISLLGPNGPPYQKSGAHVGDPPIMASGGSMTFRARAGWSSCTTVGSGSSAVTTCISQKQIDGSEIALDGVVPTTAGAPIPAGWSDITTQWTIDMYARDAAGQIARTSGVHLCTSDAAGNCGAAAINSTYVKIWNFGQGVNNTGTNLIPISVQDSAQGYQYRDNGCSPQNGQGCEHPGAVNITVSGSSNSLSCHNGACEISLGR